MSYADDSNQKQTQIEEQAESKTHTLSGAPAGARQNVRSGTSQGAVARPGGATQNSGGAIETNADEEGAGPARGAD